MPPVTRQVQGVLILCSVASTGGATYIKMGAIDPIKFSRIPLYLYNICISYVQ